MTVTPLLSRAEGVAAMMRVTHACTEVGALENKEMFFENGAINYGLCILVVSFSG